MEKIVDGKKYNTGNELLFIVILTLFAFSFCAIVYSVCVDNENRAMGNMICEDAGKGEFQKFELETKRVYCEPKEHLEKFDGGYIVTEGKNNQRGCGNC